MEKPQNFGRSLLVPNVQDMVKNNSITTVPTRYIVNPEQANVTESDYGSIPVIDMNRLLSQESTESEMAKLDYALREWGFFQLINHGVDSCLIEKVKTEMRDFFDLPIEEKKKLWQTPEEVEGFGQAFVFSDEQKLDWCDLFYFTTQPPSFRKPHLFPNLPLPFRETLAAYSSELQRLAMSILMKIAKMLKIHDDEMKDFFGDGFQSIRMNYYPPCPQPELVQGIINHSDLVSLTILLQVNEVDGLQVKKDGKWSTVRPLPNAFVVNIGDSLEIISNGAYRSFEHRVMVNSEKERLSLATFYSPRFDGVVGPAKSLISQETPALFKTVKYDEYFKGVYASELKGKTYLDNFRI